MGSTLNKKIIYITIIIWDDDYKRRYLNVCGSFKKSVQSFFFEWTLCCTEKDPYAARTFIFIVPNYRIFFIGVNMVMKINTVRKYGVLQGNGLRPPPLLLASANKRRGGRKPFARRVRSLTQPQIKQNYILGQRILDRERLGPEITSIFAWKIFISVSIESVHFSCSVHISRKLILPP
jgi:hypothetical protein